MTYRRRKDIYCKKVHGQWIILDWDNEHIRELNDVAGDIWDFLGKPRNVEEIIKYIHARYSVEKTTVERDVKIFLALYEREGFVEKTASDA